MWCACLLCLPCLPSAHLLRIIYLFLRSGRGRTTASLLPILSLTCRPICSRVCHCGVFSSVPVHAQTCSKKKSLSAKVEQQTFQFSLIDHIQVNAADPFANRKLLCICTCVNKREPTPFANLCAANMQSSEETALARYTIFVCTEAHTVCGLVVPSLLSTILRLCHCGTRHVLRNFTARGAKLATFAAGPAEHLKNVAHGLCCFFFFSFLFL